MKRISVAAIVVLVFVFLVQTKSSGEIPDVESQIKEATHLLLGNAASQEELGPHVGQRNLYPLRGDVRATALMPPPRARARPV